MLKCLVAVIRAKKEKNSNMVSKESSVKRVMIMRELKFKMYSISIVFTTFIGRFNFINMGA